MPTWIRFDERMPEVDGRYFAKDNEGHPFIMLVKKGEQVQPRFVYEWLDEKEEPAALQGVEELALKAYPVRLEKPEWRTKDEFYDANKHDRDIFIEGAAALSATKEEQQGELWEEVRKILLLDYSKHDVPTLLTKSFTIKLNK